MDFLHAFNVAIEQFSDLYNVPMDAAKIAVPAILIGSSILYMSSGSIADFLAGAIMSQ